MIKTGKKIYKLLSKKERISMVGLFAMILLMAVIDMLGVVSIMPFMAMLANPEVVEKNNLLNYLYVLMQSFGIRSMEQFNLMIGGIVFVLLLSSLIIKALTTYFQLLFAMRCEFGIATRLLNAYLNQGYSWILDRNSADLGKQLLSEIGNIIYHALMPVMACIAQSVVAIVLILMLIYINPQLAFIVGLTLSFAYIIIYSINKSSVRRLGKVSIQANKERFTNISEAFGAFKEIKVGGFERAYVQRFEIPAKIYAKSHAGVQAISQIPRFGIEAIAFGGMLLVVLYLISESGNISNALPVIALYALAGYRLMPALQQVYGAIIQIRFVTPALDNLVTDIDRLKKNSIKNSASRLKVTDAIELRDVSFSYPNSSVKALNHINLIIPSKSTVAFIGETGSGKTTAVDLLLGLLNPQNGALLVDGKEINQENIRDWQNSLGYVPQQIYLKDDTIAANIAFGSDHGAVDWDDLEAAAKLANLHTFIKEELPQGYATIVGERGVRLSGGQRQRIGIARALYHKPAVLILDEATSALDNMTERAIMEALKNLSYDVTIIMIAHRLSTVENCEHLFFLEKGSIRSTGAYKDLLLKDNKFQAMVNTNETVKKNVK